MTDHVVDATWERHGTTVIAGSPLRLFRLSLAGVEVAERLERGQSPLASPVGTPDAGRISALIDRLVDAGALHPIPGPSSRYRADDVTVVTPVHRSGPDSRRAPAPAGTMPGTVPGAVVVDDGSSPPIDGARIRHAERRGPAAARNAGLALVSTPLVAFVDDDVTVPDGWLDELLGHFDDDRVAVVAPRVTTGGRDAPTETAPGALVRYERHRSPLDLGDAPARIRAGTRVSYVPAAAMVVRTDAVRAVGGFDDALRFGEDVDLVWRLDEAGWHCRYDPRVTVSHAPRGSWSAWVRQRVGYGSSAAPLARRHPGALAPARMSGWSAASWAVGAAGHPAAGAAIGAGTAVALARKLGSLPPAVSIRLAVAGNLAAGSSLAGAVRRVWWPIVALAAVRSRVARRVLAASLLAAGDPRRVADDTAYSLGVWRGMWRERTFAPAMPRFSSWPGQTRAR